jgi:RNA polymerase sigma factor (sigma-70 family)
MTPLLAQRQRPDRIFERLYRKHVADVYRYALGVLRNESDAEDVTQTTFMNAYRAMAQGQQPDRPRTWLIGIAHGICRQRFRQKARGMEVSLDEHPLDRIEDDHAPTAADVRRALGRLPFDERAAIVMRELDGRSYADIAEVLGESVGTVETLIFRARRALREQLEESLTCKQAQLAMSQQLDGRLARTRRSPLRVHLRECGDCARFEWRIRQQRTALRTLGSVPLPPSLVTGGGSLARLAAGWP